MIVQAVFRNRVDFGMPRCEFFIKSIHRRVRLNTRYLAIAQLCVEIACLFVGEMPVGKPHTKVTAHSDVSLPSPNGLRLSGARKRVRCSRGLGST